MDGQRSASPGAATVAVGGVSACRFRERRGYGIVASGKMRVGCKHVFRVVHSGTERIVFTLKQRLCIFESKDDSTQSFIGRLSEFDPPRHRSACNVHTC